MSIKMSALANLATLVENHLVSTLEEDDTPFTVVGEGVTLTGPVPTNNPKRVKWGCTIPSLASYCDVNDPSIPETLYLDLILDLDTFDLYLHSGYNRVGKVVNLLHEAVE